MQRIAISKAAVPFRAAMKLSSSKVVAPSHRFSQQGAATWRTFASQPAIAESSDAVVAASKDTKAIANGAPAESAKAQPKAEPKKESAIVSSTASAWRRFVAFLTGLGVSSIYFYYTISADLAQSSATVESNVATLRTALVTKDVEYRARLAVLEQEIRTLRDKVNALA
jgi:hypothetical protein